MSVRVQLIGSLGNNFFPYALGRIIAEELGLELDTIPPGPSPFDETVAPASLTDFSAFFPNAHLRLPGRRVETPVEAYSLEEAGDGNVEGWGGHIIDLAAVLANKAPRQIRLCGFFQRFEYFEKHREAVRTWLRPVPSQRSFRPGKRDVLVNLRRAVDTGMLGWTLPLSYYGRILDGLEDVGQVYVNGSPIDDQARRFFDRYDPIYFKDVPIEEFLYIHSFNRVLISNSTFAWWAAFLGDAEEIYAPRTARGGCFGFTGFEDVDLDMREPRYIEAPNYGYQKFHTVLTIRDVGAEARVEGGALVIERSGRPPMRLDAGHEPAVRWLLDQRGDVTERDLVERFGLEDGARQAVVGALLRAGAVAIERGEWGDEVIAPD